ncbi:hypothetical protein TNCV_3893441 [Trichonephila clavipes]|nr:hypothetical protein TNCV_3893441 [Trichonephila clavipes]
MQCRLNDSQYGRKEESGVRHELEEKRISFFKKDQSERHSGKRLWGINDRLNLVPEDQRGRRGRDSNIWVKKTVLSSNNGLQCPRKNYRGDKIVMPSTCVYKLRPRRGEKVESRSTTDMRIQQGGPGRARKSQDHYCSLYIED